MDVLRPYHLLGPRDLVVVIMVVYHLQRVSRKTPVERKWNTTFWVQTEKFPGAEENLKK